MAKIHLDRLAKKYGENVSGLKYQEVIKLIMQENVSMIQNRVAKITAEKFDKYKPKGERIILPQIKDVVPNRSIQFLKSAQSGKIIADTLRDKLTIALRARLSEHKETGEPSMVARRGKTAGRVNQKLAEGFMSDLKEIFAGYTKKDPAFGMPKNIATIATTEFRSASGIIKQAYIDKFTERNHNYEVMKGWIQNKSMSKVPRYSHSKVNGDTIPYNEFFTVPMYKISHGRNVKTGMVRMFRPHDPSAPAGEVIGCHCDFDVFIKKRK